MRILTGDAPEAGSEIEFDHLVFRDCPLCRCEDAIAIVDTEAPADVMLVPYASRRGPYVLCRNCRTAFAAEVPAPVA
jgi:hypothetical protein